MFSTSVLFSLLVALTLFSQVQGAGPHHRRVDHRRHHARALKARDACEDGAWQCNSADLQRCSNGTWKTLRTCSGELVCSADPQAVGCIWPSDQSEPTPSVSPTVVNPSAKASVGATVTEAVTVVSASAKPSASAVVGSQSDDEDEDDDDLPYCDEVEGNPANASTTASAIGGALVAGGKSTQDRAASATPTPSSSQRQSATGAVSDPVSTAGGGLRSWSAPHHVIYADRWLATLPSASSLGAFNRLILAFWMTSGPADNTIGWQQMSAGDRASTIADYHSNGVALMVSAFGATDSPTSNGADPVQTAQNLAQYVKDYGLDGVDIDYEDMSAMDGGQAEAWLITFQQELRSQLPSPYIITHAPVAPWFTSASVYPNGAYVKVHETVGNLIDFYNIQFYNQGDGVYGDCNSLLHSSGGSWPSTSVFEIHSNAGVPLNKIVIGKPLDASMASNGYVSPDALSQCVSEAASQGWNAGVMFWEWTSAATGIVNTVVGA